MLSSLRLKNRIYYGWVVVVVSFLISSSVIPGVRFFYGVFFKSIEAEFTLSRAATASVFSTYMLASVLATLIGGWALDKYGPRIVIFISAVCAGLTALGGYIFDVSYTPPGGTLVSVRTVFIALVRRETGRVRV